ncbi:MAG: hypothetical protein OXE95_08790 [Chloroflexi bacterium]|nr:hypothetical protein [Chloroflexota bacterium]MCY4247655.1 hypothetical protein [Chloroflexota bacterium]
MKKIALVVLVIVLVSHLAMLVFAGDYEAHYYVSCQLATDGSRIEARWSNLFGKISWEWLRIVKHNPDHLYKMSVNASRTMLRLSIFTGPNYQSARLLATKTCR